MDEALTSLSALAQASADDIFYVIDDPGGSPAPKKITLSALQQSLNLAKSNLFNAAMAEFPATLYGIPGTRNNHPFLAFDDTTQWAVYFRGRVPVTATLSQGCIVNVQWMALATSGTVGWDVSFERLSSGGQDLDSDNFGTAQTVTAATVNAASGVTSQTFTTFTQAQLPASLAVGDMYRIRIRRDVANDTAVGNAQLVQVEVKWA